MGAGFCDCPSDVSSVWVGGVVQVVLMSWVEAGGGDGVHVQHDAAESGWVDSERFVDVQVLVGVELGHDLIVSWGWVCWGGMNFGGVSS